MTDISRRLAADRDSREVWLLGLAFGFLCLTAISLQLAPAAKAEDWADLGGRWELFVLLPVWGAGAWFLHAVLKQHVPERDPLLLPVAMLLAGWGGLLVWRLSPSFGARQTVWLALGVLLLAAIVRGPRDLQWLRRYRYLWLTGGILLSVLTLFFGTNPSGGEPRLWLGCCGVYLQPSEPLRLLLIAFLASFLADRPVIAWASTWRERLVGFAPLLLVWGLSMSLLVVQRDLGTGTIFFALLGVLLYLATGRPLVLVVTGVVVALGGVVGQALFDVVRVRVQAWLDPWADPTGGSYQLVQSLIAVASGGVVGTGPGMGHPGFVPAVHTDFIFASVAEEWGLVGGLALLALYALLVSRGLRVARRNRDPFAVFLAAGLAAALGLQAALIMAGVIRLAPLTGITLPFVSYGGSSLVSSFIALGFLIKLSDGRYGERRFQQPLHLLHLGSSLSYLVLALALGWWGLFRAPALTSLTANPRRSVASLYSLRGRILDRNGTVLAESVGERGEYKRLYPVPSAAPVVGYESLSYGVSGVEETMDAVLRGLEGQEAWESWWQRLRTGYPPHGLDVRLTIDADLQQAVTLALGDHQGSAVVVDPLSGDILALASAPSFDPNRLDEEWEILIHRSDAPLLQRSTQGVYQPGLSLGAMVLAWGEQTGRVSAGEVLEGATAPLDVDGATLGCIDEPPSDIPVDLADAVRLGCASAVAVLGDRLGREGMIGMSTAFALDQIPSIRLASAPDPAGILPSEDEDLRLAAAGQGSVTLTPLQVARGLSAFFNQGDLPSFRLVEAFMTPLGTWEAVPILDQPQHAVESWVVERLAEALSDRNGRFGLSAMAVAGAKGEQLAWYLAGWRNGTSARVVVVLLEGGTAQEAEVVAQAGLGAP